MTARRIFITASLLAMIAVMLGAFGAHGLKSALSTDQISIFETGVRYQFMHAIGLFIVGVLYERSPKRALRFAATAMMIGVFLFCGSLYLLSCRDLLGITHWHWLGPLTPLGGTAFIIGWACVLVSQLESE